MGRYAVVLIVLLLAACSQESGLSQTDAQKEACRKAEQAQREGKATPQEVWNACAQMQYTPPVQVKPGAEPKITQ